MNETDYINVMKQIRMSDNCRENILNHRYVEKSRLGRVSVRKTVVSAAVVAVCMSMIGTAVVFASQNDWLSSILGVDIDEEDIKILGRYDGIITDFSSDMKDFDTELVASYGNENLLSYVIRVVPKNNAEKYGDCSHPIIRLKDKVISKSVITGGSGRTVINNDGSLFIYSKYETDKLIDNDHFIVPVSMQESSDNISEASDCGSIEFSIDMSKTQNCISYNKNVELGNEVMLNKIVISPVYILIQGNSNKKSMADTKITLCMKNGRKLCVNSDSSSYAGDETSGTWTMSYDTHEVIEPEDVSAVKICGVKIYVNSKN